MRRTSLFARFQRTPAAIAAALLLAGLSTAPAPALADETCQSPYMAKITGQEEFVYVWTLGEPGVGDESDKLVTIDTRPDSDTYGKVIASVSVGGRHECCIKPSIPSWPIPAA